MLEAHALSGRQRWHLSALPGIFTADWIRAIRSEPAVEASHRSFGERIDPFNGEGVSLRLDISAHWLGCDRSADGCHVRRLPRVRTRIMVDHGRISIVTATFPASPSRRPIHPRGAHRLRRLSGRSTGPLFTTKSHQQSQ